MRSILVTIAIASFCGSAAVTGLALSAARPAAQPADIAPDHPLASMYAIDEAAAMQAMMKAGTPGPAHEWLAQFLGRWETTMTMTMGDAPMHSTGVSEYSWLMDGRYIQDEFSSEFMGMPMSGLGITGFDNTRNQFFGIWLDSFSTGYAAMHGSLDPTGKILTMVGTMDEPSTGEIGKPFMGVTTIVDANHIRFEMKEIIHGDPFTVMTIDYTRAD